MYISGLFLLSQGSDASPRALGAMAGNDNRRPWTLRECKSKRAPNYLPVNLTPVSGPSPQAVTGRSWLRIRDLAPASTRRGDAL